MPCLQEQLPLFMSSFCNTTLLTTIFVPANQTLISKITAIHFYKVISTSGQNHMTRGLHYLPKSLQICSAILVIQESLQHQVSQVLTDCQDI